MEDSCKMLGVDEEVSENEIRACGIELTRYDHPDLEKTEDADQEIREINEASGITGIGSERSDYDLQRDLRRLVSKKAHTRKIRKIILPSGIVALFVIAGLIIFRWVHVDILPKSEALYEVGKGSEKETAPRIPLVKANPRVQVAMKAPKEIKRKGVPRESKEIVSISLQRSPSRVESESKNQEESAPKMLPKSKLPVKVEEEVLAKEEPKSVEGLVPQVAMKLETPAMREVSNEGPKEVPEEVRKEVTGVPLHPGERLIMTTKEGEKGSRGMSKVIPQESARIDKPKPAVIEPQPVQKMATSVKAGEVISLPLAKEEEVKQFFSSYFDRYNQKDIDGFLSFFSSKAIHNQKDGLKGIRNIYSKFFDESQELRNHVELMTIEIFQNSVEVKGLFRVDQKLKKPREEKIWKGNIRWVLIKEDGNLKISSLDYLNQKSF